VVGVHVEWLLTGSLVGGRLYKMTVRTVALIAFGVVAALVVVGIGALYLGFYLGQQEQQEASSPKGVEQQNVTEVAAREVTRAKQPTTEQTKAATTAPNPPSAEGHGSKQVPVHLTKGTVTIEYAYQDDDPNTKGHFGVNLKDAQGQQAGVVANENGTTSGSAAVVVPRDGDYLVDVDANKGGWAIRML
jgi:hypothetical protein